MKVLLTAMAVFAWAGLMRGTIMGAARTAASIVSREGVSLDVAQRRTTFRVTIWSVLMTALAVVALIVLW